MTVEGGVASQVYEKIQLLPETERLGYIKGWMANCLDSRIKTELTALLSLMQLCAPKANTESAQNCSLQVVILLHGIRTQAIWHSLVKNELSKLTGVKVIPIGYGWFNAFQFWFPFNILRAEPEKILLREFRDIKEQYKDANLVVIAHSFSTYLISRILEDHTDIKITKLILCGSIIPRNYRWDKVRASATGMAVVNEVGTKDIWPVMATVTSTGYGCSGATGFGTNRVTDRYFNYGHSDFFTLEHIKKYWLPFVSDGTISQSPWDIDRPSQSFLLNLAGSLPIVSKFIFYGLLCTIFWVLWNAAPHLATSIYHFFRIFI
ncbi:MAG: hypothetical protein Q7T07_21100 [Burkholderiaceae bacterium]|nr:hypothetical protein [Burkholderiaceae bacterium]